MIDNLITFKCKYIDVITSITYNDKKTACKSAICGDKSKYLRIAGKMADPFTSVFSIFYSSESDVALDTDVRDYLNTIDSMKMTDVLYDLSYSLDHKFPKYLIEFAHFIDIIGY